MENIIANYEQRCIDGARNNDLLALTKWGPDILIEGKGVPGAPPPVCFQ